MTERGLSSCTSVLDQSFVICYCHQRLAVTQSALPSISYQGRWKKSLIWFLMVWRHGGRGGKGGPGLAAAAGWLRGSGPQQGRTVPRFHKTEYKQAVCHTLSVRSCTASETSIYKVWARREVVDPALGSSSCEKPADVRQGQDGRRMPREAHPPPKGLPRLSGLGLGFFFFHLWPKFSSWVLWSTCEWEAQVGGILA